MENAKIDYKSIIDSYIDRTMVIRTLSVPSVSDAKNSEEYHRLFIDNAAKIEPLFSENQEALDKYILPILNDDCLLSDEKCEALKYFCDKLQHSDGLEYIDPILFYKITDRLYKDALEKDDTEYLIIQLDLRILACMGVMILAKCINNSRDFWGKYQEEGIEAAKKVFEFLKKENFSKIESERAKELLVTESRFFFVIYEVPEQLEEVNDFVIDKLIESFEMAEDSFYTEAIPEYNWYRHQLKCLEYMTRVTERNNEAGFTLEQGQRLYTYVSRLEDFYMRDPQKTETVFSKYEIDLMIVKSRFYAGILSQEEYKTNLCNYYLNPGNIKNKDYQTFSEFQLPNEYIGSLNNQYLTEEDIFNIEKVYRGVIKEAFNMSDKNVMMDAMEYFCRLLDIFVEVPGSLSFRSFCISFLAAMYPQAYIHAVSVAELSRSICGHIENIRPELFLGMMNCKTIKEVKQKRTAIRNFAYNAAMLHDIGKIVMLPILFISERKLFPEEEEILARYVEEGARLSNRTISTKPYVNVILGHKYRYDDMEAHRDGFSAWDTNEKVIIDIIKVTDELDEMIETFEKQGKDISVDLFLPILKEKSGSEFAPYIAQILNDYDAHKDLDYLLREGRKDIYHRTYVKLLEVQDRELL